MIEEFTPANFGNARQTVIEHANAIVEEYQDAGIKLTLRSLYYQFVARHLMVNKQANYKNLTDIISKARLAGLIDWDSIEDLTRHLREYQTETSPRDACLRIAGTYIENLWENQEVYCEQWIEKDAALNTITPACGRWRLPHFSCRGNTSQTALYDAGQRLLRQMEMGHRVVILHIGDHDPGGVDMTRDNRDRLDMFTRYAGVELRRIALNMDQIEQYNPPPNFVKEKDSRGGGYRARFGTDECWELDALDPRIMDRLIDDQVRSLIDIDLWNEEAERERVNRQKLLDAAEAMEE